jgi:hypothetical protein
MPNMLLIKSSKEVAIADVCLYSKVLNDTLKAGRR